MLEDFRIVAACFAIVVGIMVVWANPSRRLNRTFLVFSLFVGGWLFCQWQAGVVESVWWVRLSFAVGIGVVLSMWLVKQTAAEPERPFLLHFRQMIPWLPVAAALAWLCFTPYFFPPTSTSEHKQFGWGFSLYLLIVGGMLVGILVQTILQLRRLSGVRRLELQLLLLGSAAAAIAVVILVVLGALTDNSAFNRAQSVFVVAFYGTTSWAIVTKRVLDARYLLAVGLTKLVLVGVVATFSWLVFLLVSNFLPDAIALLVCVGAGLAFATLIEPTIGRVVGLHQSDAESRTTAYEVARRESRPEQLETAFLKVLQTWSKSEKAVIIAGGATGLSGGGIEIPGDGVILRGLRQLRWATPERLHRERMTPDRKEVLRFLHEHRLGALVISEGPSLTALVGVGIPASHRPFTYPQIAQLIELASIVESGMERAYFASKVQHTEQLATVGLLGASLAHEIRNPLVTIKTFVQLLPRHYDDAAFRNKFFKLIGDEVTRIDALTEQLLDLASPRTYVPTMIELHSILHASLDLVSAKASHKNVQFLTEFEATPDHAYTDASAAKQVMLNLCFNAIQAVEAQEGERWVKIGTRNTRVGIEMAVADSGPGIDPEIRPRLFQPFQTTKSTGFGLGLAICSDILANLNASITVDPPEPGRGATFRVIFPCQPLSS